MAQIFSFLTGPGLAVALAVFFCGLIFRFVWYFKGLDWRLERVAYQPYMSDGMRGGVHSALKWLVPFGTFGWRAQPFFTLCVFLLHLGAIFVPFFLMGHNEVLRNSFGFSFPSMPQVLADILTVAAIVGLLFITLRRIALAEVRILTTAYDYSIIALVAVPFVTGFVARMGWGGEGWLLVHILSGEIMLILAPFTKLSHIVLYFASRWQLGADYAIKRGGHRRGPCFPW